MVWDWKLIVQDRTGCEVCVDVCPDEAIKITRATAYPEPVPGKCVGCLICIIERICVSKMHLLFLNEG